MAVNTLSEKTIITITKKEHTDEIKEMILLDALYIQSENARYCEKVSEMKWSVAVDMTEYFGYTPVHEEYYDLCDRVDFVLGNFIEEKSSEILDNFLDNLK